MSWLAEAMPPLLADLAGLVFALLFLPRLATQFQDLGFVNSVILGLFFLLFCLSILGLRRLEGQGAAQILTPLLEKRVLGALGVFFALCISLATAYVTGFLDSVVDINRGLLDEPSVTIYLLLTPASWFGLALIYMLLLTGESEPAVTKESPRYLLVSLSALGGVNLMAVATTAVWQAVWHRFSAPEGAATFVALNFILYLLLYGPPRLLYLDKNPGLMAVLSFVPLLLILSSSALP